jgi:hypothetical protein
LPPALHASFEHIAQVEVAANLFEINRLALVEEDAIS